PGLYLRPDIVGTADGLAKQPYIREARRIRAEFTITEQYVQLPADADAEVTRPGETVGIGCWHSIDLHPTTGGRNYIDFGTPPLRIPLGALIPIRVENLLPACKNIGTTHVTNGGYRVHAVEWSIGEIAGLLTAFCLERKCVPRQVRASESLRSEFQELLREEGVVQDWRPLP
ncbi:MAG TPA: FAD-dependent oxidoreductase, partial [Gemmatimonadales bacterium]|nr:FAD-dependent oxidoreductase [Gemmatimonadales bacterium]